MARYDNEDLTGLDLPSPGRLDVEEYNVYGDEAQPDQWICARKTVNEHTGVVNYYVLCSGGQMYNPRNEDARYKIRNNWKLVRVREHTFSLYRQFLSSKRVAYLHQAEREI